MRNTFALGLSLWFFSSVCMANGTAYVVFSIVPSDEVVDSQASVSTSSGDMGGSSSSGDGAMGGSSSSGDGAMGGSSSSGDVVDLSRTGLLQVPEPSLDYSDVSDSQDDFFLADADGSHADRLPPNDLSALAPSNLLLLQSDDSLLLRLDWSHDDYGLVAGLLYDVRIYDSGGSVVYVSQFADTSGFIDGVWGGGDYVVEVTALYPNGLTSPVASLSFVLDGRLQYPSSLDIRDVSREEDAGSLFGGTIGDDLLSSGYGSLDACDQYLLSFGLRTSGVDDRYDYVRGGVSDHPCDGDVLFYDSVVVSPGGSFHGAAYSSPHYETIYPNRSLLLLYYALAGCYVFCIFFFFYVFLVI